MDGRRKSKKMNYKKNKKAIEAFYQSLVEKVEKLEKELSKIMEINEDIENTNGGLKGLIEEEKEIIAKQEKIIQEQNQEIDELMLNIKLMEEEENSDNENQFKHGKGPAGNA